MDEVSGGLTKGRAWVEEAEDEEGKKRGKDNARSVRSSFQMARGVSTTAFFHQLGGGWSE